MLPNNKEAGDLTSFAFFFDRLTAGETLHGYPLGCLFVSWCSLLIEVQKNDLGECVFPEGQSGWKRQLRRLRQLHKAGIQMSSRMAQRKLGGSSKAASLAPLTAIGRFRCGQLEVAVANSRNDASLAVVLNCGIGSRSLKALVNALDKLHTVRGANSSTFGLKY